MEIDKNTHKNRQLLILCFVSLILQMEPLLVDEAIGEERLERLCSDAVEGFGERGLAAKQAEDRGATAGHGGIAGP